MLSLDGSNWSVWHMQVEETVAGLGLWEYLAGTMTDPVQQLNTIMKWIIVSSLPDSILRSMLHLIASHEQWKHLKNWFGKPTASYKTACVATEVVHECRKVKKESGQPEFDRGASGRKHQQQHNAEVHHAATLHSQKSARTTYVSTIDDKRGV